MARRGRVGGAGGHGGYYAIDGAGHSLAGRPGVHDPVGTAVEPDHRIVFAVSAGAGRRDVHTLLSGVMDRRALRRGHSQAGVRPLDLPAPRFLRK
ncbi:hypothetical protein D3C81_1516840 [compost metagenome]